MIRHLLQIRVFALLVLVFVGACGTGGTAPCTDCPDTENDVVSQDGFQDLSVDFMDSSEDLVELDSTDVSNPDVLPDSQPNDLTPDQDSVDAVDIEADETTWELPDPESYVFDEHLAFVSRIDLIATEGGLLPGLDLDFDGSVDNQLGAVLGALLELTPGSLPPNLSAMMNDAITKDLASILVEFVEPSTGSEVPFSINLWPALFDINLDGVIDQDFLKLFSGEALFRVDPVGFTPLAPAGHMETAFLEESVLRAGSAKLTLPLYLSGGDHIPLVISGLRLEGPVALLEHGVATNDVSALDDTLDSTLIAGGVVALRPILQHIDEVARYCECGGMDPEQAVLEWSFEDGVLGAECVQDVAQVATGCQADVHGFLCANLHLLCAFLPSMASLADVSTGVPGEDGVSGMDGFTVGARFSLSPATLAEPELAPDLKAVPDHFDTTIDQTYVKLDVIANDVDKFHDRPLIAVATQPQGGEVEVVEGGHALRYRPEQDMVGEFVFEYTLEGGDLESTTTVTVNVTLPTGGTVQPMDDEVTVLLRRGPQLISGILDNDVAPYGRHDELRVASVSDFVDAQADVSFDRLGIMFDPGSEWMPGDTTTLSYAVNWGELQGSYGTPALVHITFANPEVACLDAWVDDWAGEICDPGTDTFDLFCSSDCTLSECAGGGTPTLYFRDADHDGFGDIALPEYRCEVPVADWSLNNLDCDDSNDQVYPEAAEICGDLLNNGCRLTYDCGDPLCAGKVPCAEQYCDDNLDNDMDGYVDCHDPQCVGDVACVEDCSDGIDNDLDGVADCDDVDDCGWQEPCVESVCDDSIDGDGDGLTDCDDPDCSGFCAE